MAFSLRELVQQMLKPRYSQISQHPNHPWNEAHSFLKIAACLIFCSMPGWRDYLYGCFSAAKQKHSGTRALNLPPATQARCTGTRGGGLLRRPPRNIESIEALTVKPWGNIAFRKQFPSRYIACNCDFIWRSNDVTLSVDQPSWICHLDFMIIDKTLENQHNWL